MQLSSTTKGLAYNQGDVQELPQHDPPLRGPISQATSPRSKANLLNQHYANRSSNIPPIQSRSHHQTLHDANEAANSAYREATADDPQLELFNWEFSMAELENALSSLKPKRAPGLDQLAPEFFRQLGPTCKSELLNLINRSWVQGRLPASWKQAVIAAIPKTGKPPSDPDSYRPIALLNLIPKIMERMVHARILALAESRNLFAKVQAGFRRGHQVTDHLVRLQEAVEAGFQRKENTLAVFFDITQAFDTVWKEGLLVKLKKFGIMGRMFLWFKDYLSDRSICTKFQGSTSHFKQLHHGVPQGSILGPLLWLVYINDLPQVLAHRDIQVALFADDLAIWATHRSSHHLQTLLNHAIRAFTQWCTRWLLIPSAQMTQALLFSLQHAATIEQRPPAANAHSASTTHWHGTISGHNL